jgi:SAM-dependent MidA family methyltransferase
MTMNYDLPEPGHDELMRSKALSRHIRQEMARQNGSITFENFMQLALYHPEFGYYNADSFALGKHGDFTTAPEISPLFAKCFARQIRQIHTELGSSHILELGAGTGRFAQDLITALDQSGNPPDHYYIYEISASLRKKQFANLKSHCPALLNRVSWLEQLPDAFTGTIIANEVLDALPVHRFRIEHDGIREICVATQNEEFIWRAEMPHSRELAETVRELQALYSLPTGYESEINLQIHQLIPLLAASLTRGALLLSDYGYGQQEYYHPERTRGTLTCFYKHRQHNNPLILPGLQDITTHVDFTRVIETASDHGCSLAGYTTQAAFLLANGLLQFAEEDERNLSAADELSLHHAVKLLTMPTEMGERIKVMALAKGLTLPLSGFALQDRRRDL